MNKYYQFLNRKRVSKIGFSYHDSLISNFCNKYYYFQNPVIILLKDIHQQVPKEEKVITVKTFHDYQVVEPKINDILTINCPSNTLLFISSKDGYEVTSVQI